MFFREIDKQQQAAMAMLRMLMVGGMGSRVLGEARRRGLAYSVGAIGYSEPGNSSFGFTGYVTPGHAEALYEIINRSLRAAGAGEVSEVELEAAKNLLVGSITRSTQTAGDVLQWYIDRYDESDEIRDFEVELGRLRSVSIEDATNISQLILGTDQTALSLLGRIEAADAQTYAGLLSFAS